MQGTGHNKTNIIYSFFIIRFNNCRCKYDVYDSNACKQLTALVIFLLPDAQEMLLARFPNPKERPLLRILALSDGIDNKSKAKPWQVANALLKHRIVLDAILIAESSKNSELLALVKASNGYAFAPDTISQALELCELETLLSLSERPVISELAWKKPGSEQAVKGMLARLSLSARPEHVSFGVAPPRREPSELSARTMNVEKAIEMHSSKDAAASRGLGGAASESATTDLVSGESMNSAARQRLLKELCYLARNPHPAMDVFPSENNLAFWKVIMKAPKEDSCLYANGTYMLYLQVQKTRQPPPDRHESSMYSHFVLSSCLPIVSTCVHECARSLTLARVLWNSFRTTFHCNRPP